MLQRAAGTNCDELLSNSARSFDGPDSANGMECGAPLVGRGISRIHKSLFVIDVRELAQRPSRHRFAEGYRVVVHCVEAHIDVGTAKHSATAPYQTAGANGHGP